MPLIENKETTSPWFLPTGFLQTIWPHYRRKVDFEYERERFILEDGDFLDLDWKTQKARTIAIISHGITGSSHRYYAQGMAKTMYEQGLDVLAWNYRGCSGEPNWKPYSYHGGAIDDLVAVINHAMERYNYDQVVLFGFSLGANLTLKLLGDRPRYLEGKIKTAITFSCPMHNQSCADNLALPKNQKYERRFLKEFYERIEQKSQAFPNEVSLDDFEKIKSLKEYDHYYTAPLHGFESAKDYYEKCSAINGLQNISIPFLVVNALNDEFLTPQCFPREMAQKSKFFHLHVTKNGGHVAFPLTDKNGYLWSERRAISFLKDLDIL